MPSPWATVPNPREQSRPPPGAGAPIAIATAIAIAVTGFILVRRFIKGSRKPPAVTAYITRRLLLIVPTLVGIMLINFVVIQLAPGGPVEQVIAELTGEGGPITERITRTGTGETLSGTDPRGGGGQARGETKGSPYRGAQGLDPEFIEELERRSASTGRSTSAFSR